MPATQYVTVQGLIDEFGEDELVELTDRASPRTLQVDNDVAQRACDRANAVIDSHLQARYTLPLPAVPAQLPFLGRDLARYYLHEREPGEVVATRFKASMQTLRDIQSGVQPLGLDATGADVPAAATDLAEFTSGDKVFARGMV
jgi:phage gp36-like protein